MNKLEIISKEKIIKLSYEDMFFIMNPDDTFYEDLLNALQGKNENAYYNLKGINKNDFSIIEIDDSQNMESELKYGSKSIIWKMINKLCKDNSEEIETHFETIKKEFNKIEEILNNGFETNYVIQSNEIELNSLLKSFYKPSIEDDVDTIETLLFRYSYLFKFFKDAKNVFVLLKDSCLENDVLLLKEVIEEKKKYPNITVCMLISNANLAYHFVDEYPIFFSSMKYMSYSNMIEEMNNIFEIDIKTINQEKVFLLNIFSNKRPLEYLENFKKLSNYEKLSEYYSKILNFLISLK